ncbi:sugar kinase [Actinoplanes sp. NBRC 101535]|uniref:sugar kinase n=1 Tax=Actinoplanes sp. NBRC 101535 TaxID=3032196 RepID=UPI0024A42FC6|nr:sugar kinase [Actinoplanes sp. NBRC 101535]GLY02396.1 sugar kinase [Actinoplanes sp. NBRC 101535]
MSPAVLTFGEALVGYGSTEPSLPSASAFTRFLGGAELNVAVALARLGVSAGWAGVVGDDAHGAYVRDTVTQLGITAQLRQAPGHTAIMFKAGGSGTDPEVLQLRRDSAFARHADDLLAELLPLTGRRHLHLTGIPLGVSVAARRTTTALLAAARDAGLTTSFDPNLRLNLFPDATAMRDTVNAVASACTIVLPGLAEGRTLTGCQAPADIARHYLLAGAQEVVVKLGAPGAVAFTQDASAHSKRFAVEAVDTVGAGDGFAAGYLAAKLAGAKLQERVDQAAAVGALVTTRHGDLAAMPTAEELSAFRREAELSRLP